MTSSSPGIRIVRFLATLCIGSVAFAAGSDPEKSVEPVKKDRRQELVENICTLCHDLDRVKKQQMTAEEWRGVIKGMIDEGAPVTNEEMSMIVEYLAKNFGPKNP